MELEPRRPGAEYVEQPCKTALNAVRGMPFKWSLNPYMGCEHRCSFCYVRAFEKRADRPSDQRYGRSIRVKVNVAAILRSELGRRSWRREPVAVGAATDPYQPAEGRYRLTRACLQAFCDFANPMSLITRGPMIVRDVDVLTELAHRTSSSVTFSVPTLDDDVWRRTEPGTAHPRQRLRAVSVLAAAGLRVGVGMAPILPHISDRPAMLEEVVRAAHEAGASHVWANVLYLREGTREHFMECLGRYWPELVDGYERLYRERPYLPRTAVGPVQHRVAALAAVHGLTGRPAAAAASQGSDQPPREPRQLTLPALALAS